MKIAFFGTPEFAVPTLEALKIATDIKIVKVITQPDKKIGRKQIMTFPAVKESAINLDLPVAQPKNKQELKDLIKGLKVDFFVVVAYGMIFDQETLDTPKYGSINIHASLLPKYRGASPIQQSLLNGDIHSGVTIMKMGLKMDQGPIYFIKKIETENDDLTILTTKLSLLGSHHIVPTLRDIKEGFLTAIPQKESNATYCKKIQKEDGEIQWETQDATHIENMLRAFSPWPSVHTTFNNKKLKIISAEKIETISAQSPGKIYIEDKQLKVNTIDGTLRLIKVQPEGKKELTDKDFINGNKQQLSA